MATQRFKIVGWLENPTVLDAETNEPIGCFTEVELIIRGGEGAFIRLTVLPDAVDLSMWGKSILEQELGSEAAAQAMVRALQERTLEETRGKNEMSSM